MMQPEILDHSNFDQTFYPYDFTMDHQVGDYGFFIMDEQVGDCGLSTLLTTPEDTSSEVSSFPFPSTNDYNIQFPIDEETLHLPSLIENFSMELDDFDSMLTSHVVGIHNQEESQTSFFFPSQNLSSSCEVEDTWSPTPSMKSENFSVQQPSLIIPQENMEIENHVILPHLMEAYGEAIEQGQKALEEVILKCISQKVSPFGESLERFGFYLSHGMKNDGEFLKDEALKNFEAALRAFYQGIPSGKVANFAAVSAILEAVPEDCHEIHVIDFCLGNGVQWPPLIEAVGKLKKTLKLTSIKWGDEGHEFVSKSLNFEEIRRNLYGHAKLCGLRLKVEEKGLEEIVTEIKKMNKRGGRKEFLAFNCMLSLPHMGKVRSRKQALEFLRLAKDLIHSSNNKGIVIFGDGDPFEKVKNSLNFKSFFNGHLMHYHALLESVESHFPTCFSEARAAMESLFVAPCISSLAWLQNWEEMRNGCYLEEEIGLEGCGLSNRILMEVREVLRGSESSYQVRIEGQNDNELVLEWKGTQLLRVSTWKN